MRRLLVADEQHPYGRDVPCPNCADLLSHSRLTKAEQQTRLDQLTGGASAAVLRAAGAAILERPRGFFCLWGDSGVGKTHFVHALTAGLCLAGRRAIYYHAVDLRAALYADMDGDSTNGPYLRQVEALLIDELDKWHRTDYSVKELHALLDWRHRNMHSHLTVLAGNLDPAGVDENGRYWLDKSLISRLNDGQCSRPWPPGHGSPPAEFHDGLIPPVYHVRGSDMRPRLRSQQ